jgi:hypothetical protein
MDETIPVGTGNGPVQEEFDVESAASEQANELQQERRRRIHEYHGQVLRGENPLSASLGSFNAELMEIAAALGEALIDARPTGSGDVEGIMQHRAAVELYLKLTRQIDRFAQLELRAGKPVEETPSPLKVPR